ncbi:VanZ family protein [Sphingomonas tabacisoli]|uniref:VanZ family protein n=1 Tax=Sphingomonas tabacisoli TaxID=2249466 RepID=A0ABW4I4W6_9SPHN
MQRILQLAFWLAVALTLYFCLRHVTVVLPISDKKQHAFTFGGLTLLAGIAYPHRKIWAEAFALSGFGALIEFIQPYFGRDKDVKDWIADTIGILVALVVISVLRRLLAQRDKEAQARGA